MAITLGGIDLNENMEWLERFKSTQVAQTAKITLGGQPVVFAAQLIAGQPITLESTIDYGWLTLDQVQALLVLAEQPGAVYSLVFGSQTISVVFRHHDAPALDMRPFVPRVTHVAGDYFYGQIKLFTV